jgi:hypothetical protein
MNQTDEQYLELLKKCLTASIYDESAWLVREVAEVTKGKTLARPLDYAKKTLVAAAFKFLRGKSLMLVEAKRFDPKERDEGHDWPCFGYTMVGHRRLENVQQCIEDLLARNVPGDLVETGVWRGGVTIFMRALLRAHGVTDRIVWAADSFEGMPAPTADGDKTDISHIEHLKVSLEQVQANFARFGQLDDQVRFLKGWFCDTLPNAPIRQIALLRLDGDMYSSTMDALRALYPRVSPGGYVIVDDYYDWEECRRAVTDYLAEHRIQVDIRRIDWTGAYWQVPDAHVSGQ